MKAKLIPTLNRKRLALQKHIPLVTPLVIYIEPSGYCNLKCVFCPQGLAGSVLKRDVMSAKLFEKLIDDLSAFPDKIKLLRICGNGEPLINKNIVEMLQYARKRKVAKKIELVTNVILLTTDLIKKLPHFLDRIIISINGLCSKDYQRICKTDVNFQNLLDKLKDLYVSKKKCVIHIKTFSEVVFSKNKKQQFLKMFGNCCDEIYIEKVVSMWPKLNIKSSIYNGFRWGGGKFNKHLICAQIFKGVQVQANGQVVPCCVDWKRVNVIGDINKNSLFEIWNGELLRKLQSEHLIGNKNKIEPCKNCTMNDYCDIDNIDLHAKEILQRLHRQEYY